MMIGRTILAAMGVLLAASPAAAQTRPAIEMPAGRDFRHAHSDVRLPAELAGMTRGQGNASDAEQLDLSVRYVAPDGSEFATVFMTRVQIGSMPLWFDRAVTAITISNPRGAPLMAGSPEAFALPGQSVASAMAASFTLGDAGEYRTTALMLAPVGEWMVKVRLTSKRTDATATLARVRELAGALRWPRRIDGLVAAAPIADCTTRLAVDSAARAIEENAEARMQRMILAGALSQAAGEARRPATPVAWCRHASSDPAIALYGIQESADSYLVALSDSGIALRVDASAGDLQAMLAAKDAPAPAKRWSASVFTQGQIFFLSSYAALPAPATAVEALKTRPIGSVSTWGERKIAIEPGAE